MVQPTTAATTTRRHGNTASQRPQPTQITSSATVVNKHLQMQSWLANFAPGEQLKMST